MEITYKNKEREEETHSVKNIRIKLNDDVDFEIEINKFNELIIRKNQYGNGEGSILLKPSVSNEILLF